MSYGLDPQDGTNDYHGASPWERGESLVDDHPASAIAAYVREQITNPRSDEPVGGRVLTGSQKCTCGGHDRDYPPCAVHGRQETGMTRSRGYYERLAQVALEGLAKLDEYGTDEWGPGTILQWSKQFNRDGTTYSYAAIKLERGLWATTASKGPISRPCRWVNLVDHWSSGVETPLADVWVADMLIPIPEWEPAEQETGADA